MSFSKGGECAPAEAEEESEGHSEAGDDQQGKVREVLSGRGRRTSDGEEDRPRSQVQWFRGGVPFCGRARGDPYPEHARQAGFFHQREHLRWARDQDRRARGEGEVGRGGLAVQARYKIPRLFYTKLLFATKGSSIIGFTIALGLMPSFLFDSR